jgi:ribosomal protein S4E
MKKLLFIFVCLFSLLSTNHITEASTTHNQLIIINKSINQLAFYDNGKLVKTFKVATGRKPSYTPEGKMKIVNKIKNRPYYTGKIEGGDPSNPLGDRWLGLNARGTWGTTYAIHGNNNPESIGTYASSGCIRMYNKDVRWLFDQIKVNADVVITSSNKTFDQIAVAHNYPLTSKLNAISLDKRGPQPVNTSVKATATIKSGANPIYQFSVLSGSKWTLLQTYSSMNFVNYKPTKPGTYKLKVQVRNQKSTAAYEDEKVIDYIVYEPGKVTSFTTDKASIQPVGTVVTILANTNNINENLVKFSVFHGGKWKTIQDYSKKTTFSWKPTVSGDYKLKVQVKNQKSNAPSDQEKIIDYTVYEPGKITSYLLDKTENLRVGTTISLQTVNNDHKNNLVKFSVHDGKAWKTIQDYRQNTNVSWKPTAPGSYKLKVSVKNKLSRASFDQEKEFDFNIFQLATVTSLSTNVGNASEVNTKLSINATSNDATNNLYKISIFDGENWTILKDFSELSTVDWTPQKSGSYKIEVKVKHKYSKVGFENKQEIPFTVYDRVSLLELSPTGQPVTKDSLVTLTASATGGHDLQYRYDIWQENNG